MHCTDSQYPRVAERRCRNNVRSSGTQESGVTPAALLASLMLDQAPQMAPTEGDWL